MPCVASLHHFGVDIRFTDRDPSDTSSIPVATHGAHRDLFSENKGADVLPGAGAEWLRFFRTVNTVQPYFFLRVVVMQNRNRIAVGHLDNPC